MELRAHQREALARILAAVAAGERRMTVASACGSGKTLTAQRAARHLAPNGTVLVLVPTKALLVQTARRWRQSGQPGMALGVCSLSQRASGLDPGAALMVRHPRAIARAMRTGGPVTVFATYSSLHHIRRAHEGFQLPAWDLVIADEAHRTCTAFGDGWGTVHDDAALPAKLRLYMTATPRVWGAPAEDEDIPFVQRPPLATMDRREIFGPTVYELGMAAAIEMGILADYQVLLPVVADADLFGILTTPRPGTTAHLDGLRNGAIQVAVLRAIAEHGLRRVLVFHNRVAAAEAFAATLPDTAAQLDEPLRIKDLWAQAIHSWQSAEWRRDLLDDFARTDALVKILSNVRVLNEGVDIPDVETVVFADPRYSVIDAIQAIGRGLRQPPGAGKKTTLIIPVYLRSGSDDDWTRDPAFANLITLLQALRSHDESFMDRVALPTRATGAGRGLAASRSSFYAHPERTAALARALDLTIALPAIGSWDTVLAAAAHYHARHGALDPPTGYVTAGGFALGEALDRLRLRRLAGRRLAPDRIKVLDLLGFCWTRQAPTFASMLAHARAWAGETGHLTVPVREVFGGHPLGTWLARQRRLAGTGQLPDQHRQALDAIDPHWNPAWPRDWQRRYRLAVQALADARQATCPSPAAGQWHQPGMQWLRTQQTRFFDLHQGQQELLLALPVPPLPGGLYYQSAGDAQRHDFYRALGHLSAFAAREGHRDVPDDHLEPSWWDHSTPDRPPFALGSWLRRCREHPGALTPEELEALHAVLRDNPQPPPP